MISKAKIKNFVVYTKDNNEIYNNIFRDFLSFNLNILKVFRSIEDTKVVLIDTTYGKFVLKVFCPQEKRKERFAKSFVKGDYYLNLMRQTDRVINDGVLFPNDFYLLAEKKLFNYANVFIMLIEYIEGIELINFPEITQEMKKEIAEKMDILHQNNMISGDPHKGNFMQTAHGIRLIDLSGKKCNANRKAKDRIDMEKHLGILNKLKDYGYYSVVYKKALRIKIKSFKSFFRKSDK